MAFFTGLLSVSLLVWLFSRLLRKGPFQTFWKAARVGTIIMFLQAGVLHLINPQAFVYMIEDMLPYPKAMVLISGITEIVFALGLLWKKTRRPAALLLMIQLLAMFPANINVAVNGLPAPGDLPSEQWYIWSRLLFQPLYIYWVYRSSWLQYSRKPEQRPVKEDHSSHHQKRWLTKYLKIFPEQ